MKKTVFSLSLASLFMSAAVLAAPVANLKVNGKITPPTCTVNGVDQADVIFDYGDISPSVIPTDSNYNLGRNVQNIEINCNAETYLTFIPTDTYTSNKATVWQQAVFGLVNKENTAQEIGGVLFRGENVRVDGKPGFWGRAGSLTWGSLILVKNDLTGWTSEEQFGVGENDLKLVPGKVFSFSMRAGPNGSNPSNSNYAYIMSKNALNADGIDISGGIDYIGEAVLTFNFGV